jgi:hypothetical protein
MANGTVVMGCLLGGFLLTLAVGLHGEELSVPREYEGQPIQAVRFEPPLQPVANKIP